MLAHATADLHANLQASLIGIEACAGPHFIGATLRDPGHEVRLIPGQFVKPFLKSNKNDFLDAEAIAEAVFRGVEYQATAAVAAAQKSKISNTHRGLLGKAEDERTVKRRAGNPGLV